MTMQNNRKGLALIMALVMALAAAGCGQNTSREQARFAAHSISMPLRPTTAMVTKTISS